MKVTVLGENYTGAHFRMLSDPVDGCLVEMVLEGEPNKIIDYILGNFGWGEPEEPMTWDTFMDLLAKEEFGMFDGAGGLFWLKDEEGTTLWQHECLEEFEDLKTETIHKLGPIDTNTVEKTWNHVNYLLDDLRQKDVAAWDAAYAQRTARMEQKMNEALEALKSETTKH